MNQIFNVLFALPLLAARIPSCVRRPQPLSCAPTRAHCPPCADLDGEITRAVLPHHARTARETARRASPWLVTLSS
ncbi:hypothetical protein EVAR_64204_1 [Eumeta japonica]|uniref:Secreted protein n=1 Tax=Eumeta variegata TaxID=151549 RepID=A0A4C1Z4E8_EUMVA|nr:hypothetical protein EVAR_64204_1 [Eumeta japonica]